MAQTEKFDEKAYIEKMYGSAMESQKQELQQNYDKNVAALDEQQKKLQKQTDANLNRTYVEAAKDKQNYNEVQNAYGLSSGAMGQARLAQDNQLQADLTALRAAQQTADAGIEQERTLLAKEFSAAIQKAQADNDLAKVQALYEQAQREEDRLLKQQEAAANLMAGTGDYSRLAALYGLTPEEAAKLSGHSGYTGGGPVGGPVGDDPVGDDPDGGGWGEGITDPKAWAMVKRTLTQNLNSGNYDNVNRYMTQLTSEANLSEAQYNELIALISASGY
jgi:hypothetical protein